MSFKEARASKGTKDLRTAMKGDWWKVLIFTFFPFLNVFCFFVLAKMLIKDSDLLFSEPSKEEVGR
jgi:hypothetical protein